MSYTAPAGNAVNFTATGVGYTPPAGDAVNFESIAHVFISGLVQASGEILVSTPAEIHINGVYAPSGLIELDAAIKHVLFVDGAVSLGGSISIVQPAAAIVDGLCVVSGSISLLSGQAIILLGSVPIVGAISVRSKNSVYVSGKVKISGSAQVKSAAKVVVSGQIPVYGKVKLYARDNRG